MKQFEGHTPGPWMISHIGKQWNHAIHTEDGIRVATTKAVEEDGHDENEADARLIAAAPDLLAECDRLRDALRNLYDTCGTPSAKGQVEWYKAMAAARELLQGESDEPMQ